LSVLLACAALWYQQLLGWAGNKTLLTVAVVIALSNSLVMIFKTYYFRKN
jgi:hypothetical protein